MLDDWAGREGTWLSLLSPPMQELVVPRLSVAQRLFLVEPLEEAFAKFVRADHDGTGQSLTSDLYAPMVAGALARMGTVTVISPLELVRTKLQAQHVSYRELATCVQASVAQGGWRSLWLGWGPTALRDVPFSGRHLGSGHRVKEPLDNVQGLSSQVPPLLQMAMNLSLL